MGKPIYFPSLADNGELTPKRMSFQKIPKDDTQHEVHLSATAELLSGSLTTEANRAGLDNHFQRWIEDVKNADNPEFHAIVSDLQELKAYMNSGDHNQTVISKLLSRLGANTARAAVFANENVAPHVTKLADALKAAAKQLSSSGNTPAEDLKEDSAQRN